ncbi:hypothetical protein [Blastococcus sp. TF02A-35]|uniref:hypothetical protein n=1 Tax=Blastococcus sp. TF02A-35 TaxID=2559612 RepID=UPI001073F56C|nr:hypothetical protein [Blastococcus sp. TF02A_35]TFV52893.1 hypothetical protein E4P43_04675 [Blastococcus sp. TF02A_35]
MTAGATVVLLGGGAALAPMVFAEEAPRRALQAVTIDLASNGAVTGLTSALVSRGEDGEDPTTRTTALNPAEHAGDLPVRVTTSWRHDGRVGTDLADVEGADGRVEISVTVQNLTGRPERFQYDANGVARESYEMVTTPMTVVASAVLPGDGAATLVRPQPGAAEPGTTNGVVSTEDDSTTVQWASLLAPPRLAPSTTFTLVQDAVDFELPAISLAVQPGVTTDTSIARLVGDVFGGSAGMVGSENHTIGLIANVNATLAQVTDSLTTIQQTLAVNAGEVGEAATRAIASTADSVDAAAAAVLRDLEALDASVGSTVESTNVRANGALATAVQSVKDYFGTPVAPGNAAALACGEAPTAGEDRTLLGHLATVSRQLRELATASGDCVGELRSTLTGSIGQIDACPTGPVDPDGPLVCRLTSAGSDLVTLGKGLADESAKVRGLIVSSEVQAVGTQVTDVITLVRKLQTDSRVFDPLLDPSTTVPDLTGSLGDLGEDLAAAQQATSTSGVSAELGSLDAIAEGRVEELTDPTTGLQAQLAALATSVCDVPTSTDADAQLRADTARWLVDGKNCAAQTVPASAAPAFAEPLTDRIADEVQAWQDVREDVVDARAALQAVSTQLAGLRAEDGPFTLLSGLIGKLADQSKLKNAVKELQGVLGGLYAAPASDAEPWTCADGVRSTAPLNRLAETVEVMRCEQNEVVKDVEDLLKNAAAGVDQAGVNGVQQAAEDAEAAGAGADADLEGLSDRLDQQLAGAADRQLEEGRARVTAQTAALEAEKAAAAQELDAAATDAVSRLAEQISAANQSQAAAAGALQAQLQKVLLDLGSATEGRGLLGVIQNSAGQTGVRTEQVTQTSESAASFRGVRQVEVADAQLEQQQFARSLQAAQRMEPFAEDLPKGSVSATVFCFRLGGES